MQWMYVIHANGQFIKVELTNLSLYRASEMIPVSICQVVERLNGIKTHSFQIQQRTWINYWLKSCRHWGSKRSSLVFVPSCPVLSLRSFQSLWIHGRYICQIIHLTWNCGLGNLTWFCHNIERKKWNPNQIIFGTPQAASFLNLRPHCSYSYPPGPQHEPPIQEKLQVLQFSKFVKRVQSWFNISLVSLSI